MVGDVLATNHALLALARSLGLRVARHPDGGAQVLRVVRELQPNDRVANPAAAAQRESPAAPAIY